MAAQAAHTHIPERFFARVAYLAKTPAAGGGEVGGGGGGSGDDGRDAGRRGDAVGGCRDACIGTCEHGSSARTVSQAQAWAREGRSSSPGGGRAPSGRAKCRPESRPSHRPIRAAARAAARRKDSRSAAPTAWEQPRRIRPVRMRVTRRRLGGDMVAGAGARHLGFIEGILEVLSACTDAAPSTHLLHGSRLYGTVSGLRLLRPIEDN